MGPLARNLGTPHPVTAVIDTGAQTTVINHDVVNRLKLKPVGVAYINTPTTVSPVECKRYHINVYFPDDYVAENIFAVEAVMGEQPYQCLIGRDILRLGELQYRGLINEFSLIFGDPDPP